MSETPGPRAMSPSMRNGRSATVPSSNTVSMWPTSSTLGPPAPRSRPITRSPSCDGSPSPARCGRRSTSQPFATNRASHMSAITFTPCGVYEPQSTFTIASSAPTNAS